jgi:hypothetical protein
MHSAADTLHALPHLLQTSEELLERLYATCGGISPTEQKTSAMFLSTFHEVTATAPAPLLVP